MTADPRPLPPEDGSDPLTSSTFRRYERNEAEWLARNPAPTTPDPLRALRDYVFASLTIPPLDRRRICGAIDAIRAALATDTAHACDWPGCAGQCHTGPTCPCHVLATDTAPLDDEEAALAYAALQEAIRMAAFLRTETVTIQAPLARYLAVRLAKERDQG